MSCEACGGDGQIEVGVYRGDESDTTTRECRLCGGVVTSAGVGTIYPISAGQVGIITSEICFKDEHGQKRISREVAPVEQLVHHSSESGRRTVDLVIESRAQTHDQTHDHSWKERLFPADVEYRCWLCSVVVVVSRVDGTILRDDRISEIDKLSLSSRTMVYFSLPTPGTPEDIAREYTARLNAENQRRQQEVESDTTSFDMNSLIRRL